MKKIISFLFFIFVVIFFLSTKLYRFDEKIISRSTTPNDTYFQYQQGLASIKASNAWDYITDASTIKVGIVDSGVNAYHEDLSGNVNSTLSYSYDNNFSAFLDPTNHGSAIAGIIGATTNNNLGVAGVCWNVEIISIKVNNDALGFSNCNVANAITFAENNNIDILNMSFQLSGYDSYVYSTLSNFSGLVVCSSGNDGYNNDVVDHFPSNYNLNNIIAVGSLQSDNTMRINSNYGLTTVDLFAPGQAYTTKSSGYGYTLCATSYAAAYVTGAVALLEAYNPNLTPLEIKTLLLNKVSKKDYLTGKCTSGGCLSLFNYFHNHSNTYTYLNDSYHLCECSICGDSHTSPHHWTQIMLNNFEPIYEPNIRIRYECVECGVFSLNPYI